MKNNGLPNIRESSFTVSDFPVAFGPSRILLTLWPNEIIMERRHLLVYGVITMERSFPIYS